MEWKMIKPSITWDFDAFQGRTHVNLHEESKGLLPCTLSCMLPYQKETSHGHLSSATPSSSGTTAATAGASLDSGSSGIIPAINLKEICQRREFTVGDFEGPEKQQYYSERYVDASCTAKAPPAPPPPPPPSSAFTVLPYSERTFAQGKRIHPLDQLSSPLSKGLTIASSNDDDPVNLKIKQQRTSFGAPVMDHPVLRCQIDGCKEDLSKAKKDYHRRHKVCEMHSKAPGVIKSGLEQRFCQQCSRFHVVGEFDDTKRSCRRRLEGHNRRRRKSNYQGTASSFSVGSIFQLGHDKLLLNHLMQHHHHQPEMPLRRMQFYQNNEGMLRRAVGWPVAGFQEEQQQQQQGVAMASLPADFNEINSRLRAVLNYGQINKGSSSSLSLLGLQQHEEAFSSLGKALSLCTTTNGSTCALSLLSPHTLPEPVIHDQVTLDEKLPNRLNYSPNHHHQNLTLASVGLISSDPQSALPLANQPRSLALSMGTSDVSSGIKEEFYQKQVPLAAPSPCNYDNMALFPSLAPNNPFLARLLLHEAANHHHYQQLDTAMEVNAQHLQPPQGFANNF